MRRRDFIVGGTVAWALPAVGQQHGMPVIGYLGPESPERFASRVAAFREGLAEAGYVEGRNVGIEFRWADGLYSRLPALRPISPIVRSASLPRPAALRWP
jgi:putative tryptophan/tyrosine transport system substrate-binding protein